MSGLIVQYITWLPYVCSVVADVRWLANRAVSWSCPQEDDDGRDFYVLIAGSTREPGARSAHQVWLFRGFTAAAVTGARLYYSAVAGRLLLGHVLTRPAALEPFQLTRHGAFLFFFFFFFNPTQQATHDWRQGLTDANANSFDFSDGMKLVRQENGSVGTHTTVGGLADAREANIGESQRN